MTLSYCVLHKECEGCTSGVRYTVRFYAKEVDIDAPFDTLPSYVGCCNLHIVGATVYMTCMVMMEVEIEGKMYGHPFTKEHRISLINELARLHPEVEYLEGQRHRSSGNLTLTTTISPHSSTI